MGHKIFQDLGFGYPEKIYQKGYEIELRKEKISFKRESFAKIIYDGKVPGKYFLDFLIDDKVALEFKVRRELYQSDLIQLLNYLQCTGTRVGLLAVVEKRGVQLKRVMN